MLRAQVDVRQRFVATVPLGDDVRRLADATDRRCEAEIALAEGHRLLAAGDAAGARAALSDAARSLPGLKLAATIRLLAVAPSLTVALARWRRAR